MAAVFVAAVVADIVAVFVVVVEVVVFVVVLMLVFLLLDVDALSTRKGPSMTPSTVGSVSFVFPLVLIPSRVASQLQWQQTTDNNNNNKQQTTSTDN